MAITVNSSVYGPILKPVFGDTLLHAVPEENVILRILGDLDQQKRPGKRFEEPINLRRSHNTIFLGEANETKTNLASGLDPVNKTAYIDGVEIYQSDQILHNVLAKAQANGKQAYVRAIGEAMKGTRNSANSVLEQGFVSREVFRLAADAGTAGGSPSAPSEGAFSVQVALAEVRDSISTLFEGAVIEFRDSNGTAIASGAPFRITGTTYNSDGTVDVSLQEYQQSSGAYTTQTNNTLASTAYAAINSSGAYAYRHGGYSNGFLGISDILQTTASTLFGIDTTSYRNWGPNDLTVTGDVSELHVHEGAKLLKQRGCPSGPTTRGVALMSPHVYYKLYGNEGNANRTIDSSYNSKKLTFGTGGIDIATAAGLFETVSSPCMKNGEMILLFPNYWKRIGTHNWRMGVPGGPELFYPVPGTNYYQYDLHTIQAVYTNRPGWAVRLSGFNV